MRLAVTSETLEGMVIYRDLHGRYKLQARPKEMFLESVEVNGKVLPRFEYIHEM